MWSPNKHRGDDITVIVNLCLLSALVTGIDASNMQW